LIKSRSRIEPDNFGQSRTHSENKPVSDHINSANASDWRVSFQTSQNETNQNYYGKMRTHGISIAAMPPSLQQTLATEATAAELSLSAARHATVPATSVQICYLSNCFSVLDNE